MRHLIWVACVLALEVNAGAVGKAWDISPSSTSQSEDRPSWPRLESSGSVSPFEVRSVSGVGYRTSDAGPRKVEDFQRTSRRIEEFKVDPEEYIEDPGFEDFLRNRRGLKDVEQLEDDGEAWFDYARTKRNAVRVEDPAMHHFTVPHIKNLRKPRVRREADNNMEKISGTKNVREARLNSPETWSKQPISVEFRRHSNPEQTLFEKEHGARSQQAPKTDFVTGHRRDFSESRDSHEMPLSRAYPDFVPLFQEKVRERDFDVAIPRRFYPDRFRTERGFDLRRPAEDSHYYNRYSDEDLNPYGRAYTPSNKPKRIIYYAHLPEVARKPVDLRNYRYPYDDVIRSPAVAVASLTSYTRAPGNVDPNSYRYRSPYDAYRPYRRDPYKRPYDGPFQSRVDEDQYVDRAALKEDSRSPEPGMGSLERKLHDTVSDRAEARLPWPVQIGTQVNIKDDERVPGRRIFGQNDEDYNRYQVNAKLQVNSGSENSNDDQKNNN